MCRVVLLCCAAVAVGLLGCVPLKPEPGVRDQLVDETLQLRKLLSKVRDDGSSVAMMPQIEAQVSKIRELRKRVDDLTGKSESQGLVVIAHHQKNRTIHLAEENVAREIDRIDQEVPGAFQRIARAVAKRFPNQ